MVITPEFSLKQDDSFLFIEIKLKYVKISDIDFHLEERSFKMSLSPYFLNLTLTGDIVPGEECKSTYDIEEGLLTCKLKKKTVGEEFPDLNMLNKIMQTKKPSKPVCAVIEEVGDKTESTTDYSKQEIEEILKKDYVISELDNLSLEEDFSYGFNNSKKGVLSGRQEELVELFSFNPEETVRSTLIIRG